MQKWNIILGAAAMTASLSFAMTAQAGSWHNRFSEAQLSSIKAAQVSLIDAIKIAETESGGRVIEAEVDDDKDDRIVYEIEVLMADGSEQEFTVDIETGKILSTER